MRVLVVEPDGALSRLIGDLLENEGHQVRFAGDGREALRALDQAGGQALIIDLDLPDIPGLEVIRILDRRGSLAQAPLVVGLVDDLTAPLQAEADGLRVARLFPKPPSLLDLADLVRSPPDARRGAEPGDGFSPAVAARLASWWARQRTGVVQVEAPTLSAWVLMAAGGPVGVDAREALEAALADGRVEFEPCEVDGDGDRTWLGKTLWTRARLWASRQGSNRLALVDVHPNDFTSSALDLPIRGVARAALRHLRTPVSGWTLVDALRADPHELEADLLALAALGMVEVRSTAEVRPNPTPPRVTSEYPTPPPFFDELSDSPMAPPVAPPARVEPPARGAPQAHPEAAPEVRPAASPLPPAAILRLRKEADLLATADPWTTLALPRGADIAMVRQAAGRMEARYRELQGSEVAEVRELAGRILERVRAAAAGVTSALPEAPGAERPALERALAALDRQDWALADRLLTSARESDPGSAEILAHLGWARCQLSGYEADEGPTLIELAVALDPGCTDAQVYLAELEARRGDPDAALRRLRRAMQRAPGHPRGQALYRRLRSAS